MKYIKPKVWMAAIFVVGNCFAVSSWGQIQEITCYSDIFAPYVLLDGDEVRGVDVDTIAEAGRRVGIKVHFKILPWVRLEQSFSRGASSDVACAFAYTVTDARKTYMDFTTVPVKLTEISFFARRGTYESFKGFDELVGKSVGIRRGFKMPGAMKDLVDQGSIKLEEVDTDRQNFEKLALGRLFAVLSNRDVGLDAVDRIRSSDIVEISPILQVTPTYLVFNKSMALTALIPLFDKGLKSMQADGSYRKIKARYK
jgi:polar amino acid transport system substrate-binding protein